MHHSLYHDYDLCYGVLDSSRVLLVRFYLIIMGVIIIIISSSISLICCL
jgi:hypothetical protein